MDRFLKTFTLRSFLFFAGTHHPIK
jgi:hypothetical protein